VVAPIMALWAIFHQAGDYVSVGQTRPRLSKCWICEFPVPSNNATQLRQGLPVELLDADTGKQLTTGSISFISLKSMPMLEF